MWSITITFNFWSVQSIAITQKTVTDYDYLMSDCNVPKYINYQNIGAGTVLTLTVSTVETWSSAIMRKLSFSCQPECTFCGGHAAPCHAAECSTAGAMRVAPTPKQCTARQVECLTWPSPAGKMAAAAIFRHWSKVSILAPKTPIEEMVFGYTDCGNPALVHPSSFQTVSKFVLW